MNTHADFAKPIPPSLNPKHVKRESRSEKRHLIYNTLDVKPSNEDC